jgi:hypothetical protein
MRGGIVNRDAIRKSGDWLRWFEAVSGYEEGLVGR